MNRYILSLFFVALSGQICISQTTNVDMLPEVDIVAKSIRSEPVGSSILHLDSSIFLLKKHQNVGELLAAHSTAFVRSYGLGSLATASLQGGASGHTAVLWNGLPIQSPMVGLQDFSLLPNLFFEEANVQSGGSSAQWGSGAISGTVSLDNHTDFSKKNRVETGIVGGSFGRWQQQLKVDLGNTRWQSRSRLFHHQARNDFAYRLAENLPKQTQSNAAILQQAALQSFYFRPRPNSLWEAHFWQQYSDREIPPLSTQTRSEAKQKDLSTRAMLSYKNIKQKSVFQAKSAFFQEKIRYFDPLNQQNAPSAYQAYLLEGSGQTQWGNQIFHYGTTQNINTATADGYGEIRAEEWRSAAFVSHVFKAKKWSFQSTVRQTLWDGKNGQWTPAVGFSVEPKTWISVRGKIGRNYRYPTLNDRYWATGGNPNLLPEFGWSQELGFDLKKQRNTLIFEYHSTAFNRRIHNWILWSRTPNSIFWSAQNIAEVWSRGLEQRLEIAFKKPGKSLSFQAMHAFTLSTNQIGLDVPKIEKGAQLFYTPKHTFRTSIQAQSEHWGLQFSQQFSGNYTGIVYEIKQFSILDASLNYANTISKTPYHIFIETQNILNTQYEVVERRPMPGRNWAIGLDFTF